MQDRYAGDIGDFVKLGLLRAVSGGRSMGLLWYRFPDETHNSDGRHVSYLDQPSSYAHLDPELFEHLRHVVKDQRRIASLLPVLDYAHSVDACVDQSAIPVRKRRPWRRSWFSEAMSQLARCDLVFADPDNGIVDGADKRRGLKLFGKQMPLDEVRELAGGRCAIIYHHNTRRKGGHDLEVDHWISEIGMPTMAVRAKAFSPRTFFVINPDETIRRAVDTFCRDWHILKVGLHQKSD